MIGYGLFGFMGSFIQSLTYLIETYKNIKNKNKNKNKKILYEKIIPLVAYALIALHYYDHHSNVKPLVAYALIALHYYDHHSKYSNTYHNIGYGILTLSSRLI